MEITARLFVMATNMLLIMFILGFEKPVETNNICFHRCIGHTTSMDIFRTHHQVSGSSRRSFCILFLYTIQKVNYRKASD